MRSFRLLSLGALITLLCLTSVGAFALGHHQSGIIGQTALGWHCDASGLCVPNYVPMHLLIQLDEGRLIADIESDSDGLFEIALKPGTYKVTPYFPAGPGGTLTFLGHPLSVIVEKKEYTVISLHYVPLSQPIPPTRPPPPPPLPPLPAPGI